MKLFLSHTCSYFIIIIIIIIIINSKDNTEKMVSFLITEICLLPFLFDIVRIREFSPV
jgi:hypothetical protein